MSDGSLRSSYPAHAWCFANKMTGEIVLSGSAPVDGNVAKITSYRAEALGLLAMAEIVQNIFKEKNGKVLSNTIL